MWTPYFCIIWPCPYSEIQWYISHNRLKRLDFSFGQSVFSFLMVNSKGGCSSILLQVEDDCMVTFKPVALLTQAIAELIQNGDYRFLISCLQNVKGLSLNPELHQIALVPQKTHRQAFNNFIYWVIHWLIWSYHKLKTLYISVFKILEFFSCWNWMKMKS